MPPFRAGLLKRKSEPEKSKATKENETSDSNEFGDDEDLFSGTMDDHDDSSDSENEDNNEGNSDSDVENVLFPDDADSTLGDEKNSTDSDESSELADSEDDVEESSEEDEGNNGSDESKEESEASSNEQESEDSGAETAPSLPHSSDEADKKQEQTGKKQVKQPKVTSKKLNQIKSKTKKEIKPDRKAKSSIDMLSNKIKETSVTIKPVEQKDEYESGDTSDEEDRRNTRGAVPAWWYREYPHVGYDLDGRRVLRPPRRDLIDDFLKKCSDPEFWRTVQDPSTGQDVRLSVEDLELLQRLRAGHVASGAPTEEPWVEWFSREVLATPVRAFPDHKRSFLPSRDEQRRINKIVHALKMGWTKTRKQIADERRLKKERKFYNLWGSEGNSEQLRGIHRHIPAPRRPLPGHAESYNPPPEYLLDAKEMKEWEKLAETPWKRKYTFLPRACSSLRAVAAFPRYTRERFLRCLDLYLAPRAVRMRLTITPEDLVPKLPSPRELQPFPQSEALRLEGHAGAVRGLALEPGGQYLASTGDDGTLKVWELSSGRCLRTIELGISGADGAPGAGGVVLGWSPAAGLTLLAVGAARTLLLVNPGADIGCHRRATLTDSLLERDPLPDKTMDARTAGAVTWRGVGPRDWARGVRLHIDHFKDILHMDWHARGDYVCVTLRDGGARGVVVHQVSRRRSQLPLARLPGLPQAAVFHPRLPRLLLATQRAVRIYDLSRQQLVRKLQAPAQWLAALSVHPAGDNLLAVSYDRKVLWWDLELSARPFQSLRLHGRAVRAACFHARYPLFATGGDDYIVVSHGMVYNDLLQNPLLVPLKQLAGGAATDGLNVLALRFHPTQPWLLAACADGTIRLYS